MFVKIHKTYRNIVAICDSDLIGKQFEEGNAQLDIKESFYKGDEVSREKLLEIIEKMSGDDSTFNIVGKESVKVALDAGIIIETGIKKIQGIPYAMALL